MKKSALIEILEKARKALVSISYKTDGAFCANEVQGVGEFFTNVEDGVPRIVLTADGCYGADLIAVRVIELLDPLDGNPEVYVSLDDGDSPWPIKRVNFLTYRAKNRDDDGDEYKKHKKFFLVADQTV